MSNLRYLTTEQLHQERQSCIEYMKQLKSSLVVQEERLKWIEKYIFEKTPQELTLTQIEQALGHRVIIKPDTKPC